MLRFQGDKDFPQALPQVWEKMSDARFLVQCIPGGENITLAEADKAVCSQKPGFSFVRGTLELTILIADRVPNESVKMTLLSKGIGSNSAVAVNLQLQPTEAGTHLHYEAEVTTLGGLLKAVPQGLIRGAAAKIISDTWEEVGKRLSEPIV